MCRVEVDGVDEADRLVRGPLAAGRPGRAAVAAGIEWRAFALAMGHTAHAAAVCIHHVDVRESIQVVSVAAQRDQLSVRRPGRIVEVRSYYADGSSRRLSDADRQRDRRYSGDQQTVFLHAQTVVPVRKAIINVAWASVLTVTRGGRAGGRG